MFPTPQPIKVREFTRLPERFRQLRRSAWGDSHRGGATAHSFLEGPSFDRAGNLWLGDIPFGRVFRISPAGEWDCVAEYDGWPNGLKFHRDGRIFIADYRRGHAAGRQLAQRGLQGLQRPPLRRRRHAVLHRPGDDRPSGSERARVPPRRGWPPRLPAHRRAEPERAMRRRRLAEGIPIDPGTWAAFVASARSVGVELPERI